MKTFSTQAIASGRQLSAWREIMSEVYFSLEIKSEAGDGFRGLIKEYDVGPVSITTLDSDQQRAFRTKGRISVDPDDSFVFIMPVHQELYFSQLGRSGTVTPGGYVLVSTSEFYELACPDGYSNWTVKMPGEELRRRIPDIEDYCACRFPNNMAMAKLAGHHTRAVGLTFETKSAPNESALAHNLMDFFALVVRSEPDNSCTEWQTQHRLRRRVVDYIRAHLHDPDLTPRRTADDCGISLSYLYKVFQPSGVSVGKFILNERLQAAYEQLAAPEKGMVSVAEAAYAAGFRNVSHFSRAFSQKYSMPPSTVRKRSISRPAHEDYPVVLEG